MSNLHTSMYADLDTAIGVGMTVDDETTQANRSAGPPGEAGAGSASMPQRLGLAGLCLGTALIIMEANVLNVAIPSIRQAFHASPAQSLWIIDAYTLVLAALLLSAGRLGDRIGARRCYLLGLAVFSIASVLCALAASSAELIAARTIQGVGAAVLIPAPLGLISAMFSDLTARTKAVAVWVTIGGVGFAAGPLIGGLLVSTFGWRSIFLINIPAAAIIAVMVRLTVAEASRSPLPFDYVGQALAIVGLSAVVFACVESSALAWMSPFVLLPAVAAALILGLFVIDQRHRGRAGAWVLLPVELLNNPPVNAGLMSGFVYNFTLYGLVLVYSYVFQSARGYSPVQSGLAFAPLTVAALVTSLPAGRFVAAHGARRGIMIGMALSAIGLCALAFDAQRMPFVVLSIAFGIFATGLSFSATGQTMAVMANASDEYKNTASSMLNTARQTGGVIGVAALGAITSRDLLASAPVALTIAAAACLVAALGGATLIARHARTHDSDQH